MKCKDCNAEATCDGYCHYCYSEMIEKEKEEESK